MPLVRLSMLATTVLIFSCGPVAAQRPRPRPQTNLPTRCEIWDYRTKLEEFEDKHETVLIKGYTVVSTLAVRDGTARVDAVELRDSGNATRAMGIAILFTDANRQGVEERALIDYEEIGPLIKGLDTVARADETITK